MYGMVWGGGEIPPHPITKKEGQINCWPTSKENLSNIQLIQRSIGKFCQHNTVLFRDSSTLSSIIQPWCTHNCHFYPYGPPLNPQDEIKGGLNRDSNPGPLAPKARIIPLDHWATKILTVRNIGIHLPFRMVWVVLNCFITSYFKQSPFNLWSTSARLAQSVEHQTLNLRVVGSSPTLGEAFMRDPIPCSNQYVVKLWWIGCPSNMRCMSEKNILR